MAQGMRSYEAQIAPVKRQLFQQIRASAGSGAVRVLEIGIGTGPNLEYYGGPVRSVAH
jgi:hypothetical protein